MTNPTGIAALEEEDGILERETPEPPGRQTMWRLLRLVKTISQSGNPDEPFFYLMGPMTGIPQFNFPRFREVGDKLRVQGYNIISPAELDDLGTEAAALASPDGAPGTGHTNGHTHSDFLSRDLVIVGLPTCIGVIGIEGWENSLGAAGESWAAGFLKKQILAYVESPVSGEPMLVEINRDEALAEAHGPHFFYVAGSLPRQKPGEATVAATQKTRRNPLSLDTLSPR